MAASFFGHLVHARQLGVDLAGDEVALAERLQQLAQRLVLLRHQLEDEQRRDEAVVGVVEVAEVVVAGDLAGEDAVFLRASAA